MNSTQKTYLWIILFLSIIGLLISLDLTKSHLSASTNTPCDITPSISCSLVNTSVYSELLNVPVALFGLLWFLALGVLAFMALYQKETSSVITALLYWNVLGVLFVTYLIFAEFLLRTLCPLCTVIHFLVVISLSLSVLLYRSQSEKTSLKFILKSFQYWILLFIIINIIPFILFNTIAR